MSLKVLFVTHGFPPDQMAGAEVYSWAIARGMRARGVDVCVLSPAVRTGHPDLALIEEEVDGVRVLRLNQRYADLYRLRATYQNDAVDALFAVLLERERPDVVHVQHVIGVSAGVLAVARRAGVPVVMTLHDYWFHCPRGQRMTPRLHLCEKVEPWRCAACVGKKRVRYLLNWLGGVARGGPPEMRGEGAVVRSVKAAPRVFAYLAAEGWTAPIRRRRAHMQAMLECADLVLSPSEHLRAQFIEGGLPAERIEFSENGLDTAPFATLGPRPPIDGARRPLRFGFVGTLIPNKGCDLLVEAFQSMPEGRATLDVYGAGGGPNAARDEARLRTMNRHPGVVLRGRFDNRRIAEILRALDVLVVPSRWWENSPLTLHEAVMADMAAVTADHGGMREIAERFGNMLTFAPGDAADLGRVLRRFLDEPALLESLRPRRAVRTLEDDVSGLLARYQRLIAARLV
jgi:glycosyltransferase involved in cell wall biosynthesis